MKILTGEMRDLIQYSSTKETLEANRTAGKESPLGGNVHHDGKAIACIFEGGIDREGALREPRAAFRNKPTQFKEGMVSSPDLIEPALFLQAMPGMWTTSMTSECNHQDLRGPHVLLSLWTFQWPVV